MSEKQLNPDQARVRAFTGNLCVLAGAGSGKTHTLIETVMGLLELEDGPSVLEIVAITFTEKAAQEMKDRLRRAILARAQEQEGPRQAFWRRQRRLLDRAMVTTIHGFCRRVLIAHALEAGVDQDFEIITEPHDIRRQSGRQALLAALNQQDPDLARLLDHFPWAGGPRLENPAGLGLRLDELNRAAGRPLSPPGFDPGLARREAKGFMLKIKNLAQEGQALAQELRNKKKPPLYLARLEELAAWANQDHPIPELTGPEAGLALMELESLLGGNWGQAKELKNQAQEQLAGLKGLRAQALAAPLEASLDRLSRRLGREYARAKRQAGGMDFEDLLIYTRDLLKNRPDIREKLKQRFKYFFVDEFQDTNQLQAEIIASLTEREPDQTQGPRDFEWFEPAQRRLVILGDPKQSIYGFRGARVEVYNQIASRLDRVSLAVNYRSRPALVEFFNAFFSGRMPKQGQDWQASFSAQDRQRPAREGAHAPLALRLKFEPGASAAENQALEAAAIARAMAALPADPLVRVGPEDRAPRPGDMAILFRRLTISAPYEQALAQAGLPYFIHRGNGFYACQEVWDLAGLIFWLADPQDETALLGLLRSPLFGVEDQELARLGLEKKGIAAWFAAPGPDLDGLDQDRAQGLKKAHQVLKELSAMAGRAEGAELVERALELTDYAAVVLAQPQGWQKAANVQKFIQVLRAARVGGAFQPLALAAFLRERIQGAATAEPEASLLAEGRDAVKIMTIHQAKGLEFPIVFVPDCAYEPRARASRLLSSQDRFCLGVKDWLSGEVLESPTYAEFKELEREKTEAESLRLLYVAMTRAEDLLVLSGAARGRVASGKSWLGWIEEFAAQDKKGLLGELEPANQPPAPTPPTPGDQAAIDPGRVIERVYGPRPFTPAWLELSVTDLALYLHCPNRWLFERVLGLGARASQGDGLAGPRAARLGTLLHRVLEETPLAAPPSPGELEALARREAARAGLEARDAAVCAALAQAFLASGWGRLLLSTRGERVYRELALTLSIEGEGAGPGLNLHGEIDLFFIEPGREQAFLVDYKYTPRPKPERYQGQVLAYALGLSRAGLCRGLNAGLFFAHETGCRLAELPLATGWEERVRGRLSQAATEIFGMMNEPSPIARPCLETGCGYEWACPARRTAADD